MKLTKPPPMKKGQGTYIRVSAINMQFVGRLYIFSCIGIQKHLISYR